MSAKEQDWSTYQNPYIMMLQLDRSRQRERIIIGEDRYKDFYPKGSCCFQPILDITRPLGSLLFDMGEEDSEEWNTKVLISLSQIMQSASPNKHAEETSYAFLLEKMNSANPATKFAALQCAYFYQKYINLTVQSKTERAENFLFEAEFLRLSFTTKLWDSRGHYSIQPILNHVARFQANHRSRLDSTLTIWYPGNLEDGEWICVSGSFYPVLRCYLQRLVDWNICIRRCQVCKKPFLAPNNRYNLCSKACKKKRSQQHKQAFDTRAKKNGYDIDYKNATQRMRNRLKKLQKSPVSDVDVAQAQAAFKSICKEACAQKKNIYSEYGHKAFQDWLFQQEREFEQLCDIIKRQA